jgi:VWFA-related protein
MLLEMTSNRRALKNALREQAEAGSFSLLSVDSEDEKVLEAIQYVRSIDARIDGGLGSCLEVEHLAHNHAEQVYARVLGTVSELNRFVNSLAGYEGPKALLHVSDGIPLVAGSEAYRYASELCDGTGVNAGVPSAGFTSQNSAYWDPTKTAATLQEFDTSKVWSRLASHANTYQVRFYPLQARQRSDRASTVTDTRTSMGVEMEGARNRQDPLFLLADETGGTAMLDANDVEPALSRIRNDSQFSYQLAFENPASGDDRQHEIRVEVTRPGLRVRHRKSYSSKPPDQRVEDRVVSALIHGLSDNPLGIRVEVGKNKQVAHNETHVRVRVFVPLDRIVLLPEEESKRGLFRVFVAVRNEYDQVSPIGHKIVPVSVPLTPTEEDFVYDVEVPVRGEYGTIAIAVQDQLGAEVSYLARELRIRPEA